MIKFQEALELANFNCLMVNLDEAISAAAAWRCIRNHLWVPQRPEINSSLNCVIIA